MIELEFKQRGRWSKKNSETNYTWNYNQRQLSRNKNKQYIVLKGFTISRSTNFGTYLRKSIRFQCYIGKKQKTKNSLFLQKKKKKDISYETHKIRLIVRSKMMVVQQFFVQKFKVKNKWPRPFYLAKLTYETSNTMYKKV